MSKSLIQVVNQTSQTLVADSIINPGSTVRRYGCNCRQNGNAIELTGTGYYTITGAVTLVPNAVGNVSIALYENGVQVPGTLVGGSVSTVGNSVTLPIVATVRRGCYCDGADSLICKLVSGPSTATNFSLRVEKS